MRALVLPLGVPGSLSTAPSNLCEALSSIEDNRTWLKGPWGMDSWWLLDPLLKADL
jgi:hypothetical protein